MSDINIISSGLDSILLKPFEEQIKSTFESKHHKSLALLHSWDEIVYKDNVYIKLLQLLIMKNILIKIHNFPLFIWSSPSLIEASIYKIIL